MKSETEIRKELELLQDDLKMWQEKYDRVDMRRDGASTQRMIIGNTMVGLEGRMEALRWVLGEE